MSYRFKFNKVGGRVCCQGDFEDLDKFCPSCKAKAAAQELAWRQENARRNDMRRKQQEEQARIDAARGNPGKENQMRIGQGNQTPAPAGCRCGKCGGVKTTAQAQNPARAVIIARLSALPAYAGWRLAEMSDSALAELDRMHPAQVPAPAPVVRAAAQAPAPAVTPAASPLRASIIARLSSRLPVSDLNSMNDEMLTALDRALTASASAPAPAPVVSAAPAPTLRELPDPWGVNAQLKEAQRRQNVVNQHDASLRAAREHERNNPNPNLRPLPDTLGLKAAEARRAEEAQNEEAKRLEEQRIAKENSGWGKVNAMVKAAQKEANKNRAAYEAVEQAREHNRKNLRPLPDPLGLKKLGIE